MSETLPDILAAAAHDVGLSTPGHCLHNAYGSECVDVMSRVLAAIPARDREAWETGRLLERVTSEAGTGYVSLSRSAVSGEWTAVGYRADRTFPDGGRVVHGGTPLAALTSLLAQLDPTR